jgi:hypothetical protein
MHDSHESTTMLVMYMQDVRQIYAIKMLFQTLGLSGKG